jgi:tRNA pseudouridine55 synthase
VAKSDIQPGFLNVQKVGGMTAHDVVNRLRRLSGIKQIGHAGTLDPMARGVLPVAFGRACRLLRFLSDDKVYLATILFGARTDTDDVEGRVIERSSNIPTRQRISEALKHFVGNIEQVPPLYSAIHVGGKRLYELARRGETAGLEIPGRNVHIYSIEELDYREGVDLSLASGEAAPDNKNITSPETTDSALLQLRVHCASGTYIRSLARDLGVALGSAACLAALVRERFGLFSIQDSHCLADLQEAAAKGTFASLIEPPQERLGHARVELSEGLCRQLASGQRILVRQADLKADSKMSAPGSALSNSCPEEGSPANVLALRQGKLIAVCRVVPEQAGEEKTEFSEVKESSIVELQPEVVLLDGSSL